MGDTTDDLSAKLAAQAEAQVGNDAVLRSEYGKDCFVLVDSLLRSVDAETAEDGSVPVTPRADYDWGDPIPLEDVEPGTILQFRNHVVERTYRIDYSDGRWEKSRTPDWWKRPHHTAIVVAVEKDNEGKIKSVTVVEQNVHPNPDKVTRNVILRLPAGREDRETKSPEKTRKDTIIVTGTVKAYRPKLKKKKEGRLLHPMGPGKADRRRMLANFVPLQGGPKRAAGPIGMDPFQPGRRGTGSRLS